MRRPDDIPEDVWAAAAVCFESDSPDPGCVGTVARAILAERERCAKLAESGVKVGQSITDWRPHVIAAAIRSGKQ